MRIIASPLALDLVLALTQRRDGARLAELATAVGASLSAGQAGTRLLLADGLIEREPGRRPRYRLRADHRAGGAVTALASRSGSPQRAIDIVARANPSVEFAARDRDGYLLVEAPLADPRDLVLLETTLATIRRSNEDTLSVARLAHADTAGRPRDDPHPRRRAERAKIVKGSLRRSFPSHDARRARQGLPRPSRRALRALARAHGLARVQIFGSAARGALRTTSDVDVIVASQRGRSLSLLDLARLEADLEDLFDRHVDVMTEAGLRGSVRARAAREAMTLFG